jgi:quercetin dioxygenase-like cupin family protein
MAMSTVFQLTNWDGIPAEHPLPGVERRMMVGDGLMICRLQMAAHTVTPVHAHHHEQMTIVQRGRVKFYIGDDERVAGPGDVLHFPSNLRHGATMLDEDVVVFDIFTPVREDFLLK